MTAEYYYVTKQSDQTDFHVLHRKGCSKMPEKMSLVFIGSLYNALQALTVAKVRVGENVKPCYFCCQSLQGKDGRRPQHANASRPGRGFEA